MLVFLTLHFFILIKPCVTGTDFPLWYYMPFTVAGDPSSKEVESFSLQPKQNKKITPNIKFSIFACAVARDKHTL